MLSAHPHHNVDTAITDPWFGECTEYDTVACMSQKGTLRMLRSHVLLLEKNKYVAFSAGITFDILVIRL